MLQQLQNYYERNGILATAFTCRHKLECSKDCVGFTGPKSAYVGTGYERNELPRLLFVSLDSGSADLDDSERLPTSVRRQEEIERDIRSLPKGRHWYRTHELAWYILRRFKPDLNLLEAKHYFAHANSAKCCMNNRGRKKAASVLFKNCEKYLKEELAILAPRIIVTQGREAKVAVGKLVDRVTRQFDDFASVVDIGGVQVFWLRTHHPNNYGAFNNHRRPNKASKVPEGWELHANQIELFIGGGA
jgi:hypothetical protein